MAYPIVTPVSWALGRYDSYTLHPDGTLVGTIHPPGLAFEEIGKCQQMVFLLSECKVSDSRLGRWKKTRRKFVSLKG
jgi:hypothetical protein